MRSAFAKAGAVVLLGFCAFQMAENGYGQSVPSQQPGAASSQVAQPETDLRYAQMERRLAAMSATLQQSLDQIQQMQHEIETLRLAGGTASSRPETVAEAPLDTSAESSSSDLRQKVAHLAEEQEAMQAEIKQHEQMKVETASKYPVRFSGLVLFNTFSNAGVVDEIDLPSLALPRAPGTSHGSIGASLRQTVFGLEGTGPNFGGARTSADLSIDFFGGLSSSYYDASGGAVRLRHAVLNLDWEKTAVQVGMTGPLISPLSPTSFATVAQPSLSWAGNLWVWGPQAKVERRISLSSGTIGLEAGLWDPQPIGINDISVLRTISAGEQARRPAYEGRVSWRAAPSGHAFSVGLGGYSSQQLYDNATKLTSWAGTADWQLSLGARLDLSGEAYRGSGLGSLGGGAYKDVLSGVDPVTGKYRTIGLNATGGWSQLKFKASSTLEVNATFGLDNAFASDFRRLLLTPSYYPLQFSARNSMIVGNLIYRPKTYIILSPEYRRIRSWQNTGAADSAHIFSLNFGYQF